MTAPSSHPADGAAEIAPEIVVAGHVSLDVYPALSGPLALAPGQLVIVGPAVMSTGGAVANTGLALHRLGARVKLIAKVGDDLFGTAVRDALAGPGLAAGITVSAGEATSYTIVINPPGVDRSFLHCPGANRTFTARDVPYDSLGGARLFHFGYPPLMPLMYAAAGAQLHEMFARVHDVGPATSLDLCKPDPDTEAGMIDWPAVLAKTLPEVDVFAPSIDDLLFMFDRPAHDRLRAGAALASELDERRLSELGAALTEMGATVVAIKLGDQGLYLRTATEPGRIAAFCDRLRLDTGSWLRRELLSPCFQTRRIGGTTGSGDATVAGLLVALLRGAGPAEAATLATAVGACSVEEVDPVSGIPSVTRVTERLSAGWRRLPVELTLRRDTGSRLDSSGTIVLVNDEIL